jgi:hypothetical protein
LERVSNNMVGLWASVAECAGAVSQARGYIGAATLGAAGALVFTRGARHRHAHGHGHGHGHGGPRETARLLEAEGRGVPVFLAPPHASGHVPVHSAVATLASTLRRVNPTSDTLGLVSTDYLGRVHPAFPPHDERHRPPHAIALAMHEELGAASPWHAPDARAPLTTEAATAKGSERRLDDVVRRLEARVVALEAENRTLRAAGRQER